MKAVLLLCILVFRNFSVGFGCSCRRKNRESNALQNLLGAGTEETLLSISDDCLESPDDEASTWFGFKENGETYEVKNSQDIYRQGTIGAEVIPQDSCRVGLDNSDNNAIKVIPNKKDDKDFKQCPLNGQDELQFQSVFLLFKPNMNTFMFLDPNKAKCFFTSELGGCDIFVAIDPNKRDNLLVIHSNMNLITNDKDNLKHKSDTVDMIMKFFPGYQLKARVYHRSESPDVPIYMATYQSTHHIKKENIVEYDTDLQKSAFYFFGYYKDSAWGFFIKAQNGGKTNRVW